MKLFILSLVLMAVLSGCFRSEDMTGKEIVVDYANWSPVFQSEFTNYAWGYSHNGWMLDNTGQVRTFQRSAEWVFPDSLGYISTADMQKNMLACDVTTTTQISSSDFAKYAAKAITCANGPMSKATNTMVDGGEHIYAIYLYESGGNRYKRFILNMTGDRSQENLASNAKEVVEWMGKIK